MLGNVGGALSRFVYHYKMGYPVHLIDFQYFDVPGDYINLHGVVSILYNGTLCTIM